MLQVVPGSRVPVCPHLALTGKAGPECASTCPRSEFKHKDIPVCHDVKLMAHCPFISKNK